MPLGYNGVVYVPTGDPRTASMTSLYAPGDLGSKNVWNFGTSAAPNWCEMQLVLAKASITYALGEVLWWDDRTAKVVTNVSNGGVVAGIAAAIYTAATYVWVFKKGGVSVKYLDSPTVAPDTAGKLAIASATNGRADCVTVASTLVPIGRTLGAQDGTSKLALTALNIFDEAA